MEKDTKSDRCYRYDKIRSWPLIDGWSIMGQESSRGRWSRTTRIK